jgi:hypothetical protein
MDICIPDLKNCIWIRRYMFHKYTRGSTKMPCIFVSETVITITIKLAHIVGTSFSRLRLFLHKLSFIIQTHFFHFCTTASQLHKTLHCRVKAIHAQCFRSLSAKQCPWE